MLVGFGAFLALFVTRFVGAERYVHFWDTAGFWPRTVELRRSLATQGLAATLATVRDSVRHDEYGALPALLALPGTMLLGESRLGWVLSVMLLFGMPSVVAFVWLMETLLAEPGDRRDLVAGVALVTITLVPQIWLPVLAGLLDIVGCVPIFVILGLARGSAAAWSWRRAAAIGALLGGLVLLRRWYAYWAVAFFPAALAAAFVEGWSRTEGCGEGMGLPGRAGALPAAAAASARLALAGAVAAAVLAALALPAALRMLATDWTALYAAYRVADTLPGALGLLLAHQGLAIPALAVLGLATALADPRLRAIGVLVAVQAILVFVWFSRTQTLGWHHQYLLLPGLLVLAGVAVVRAGERVAWAAARRLLLAGYVALLALGFAAMLEPAVSARTAWLAPLVSRLSYAPPVRGDLEEIGRLTLTLDALTRDAPGRRIYVLSSSTVLNESIVGLAHLADPGWPDLRARLLPTAHVDLRDGFPWALAVADLVVASHPVGLHLPVEHQRVVELPALRLAEGSGIGRWFRRRPESFSLDGGVRVSIYERAGDVPEEDLVELAEALARVHPGAEELLDPPGKAFGHR